MCLALMTVLHETVSDHILKYFIVFTVIFSCVRPLDTQRLIQKHWLNMLKVSAVKVILRLVKSSYMMQLKILVAVNNYL